MSETNAQRIVRGQGMCGELLHGGRDICILSPGHGDHYVAEDREAIHTIITEHLRPTTHHHLRSVQNGSTDALENALVRYCQAIREYLT